MPKPYSRSWRSSANVERAIDEPRRVEQPPERVALAGEVVAERGGAQSGVDADEERAQIGREDVGDARH